MNLDVEKMLARELHEVADGLQVPALPALPQERTGAPPRWQPMLVAAAVVLIVAGAVAVLTTLRDGDRIEPAPAPTESPSEAVETVRPLTSAPTTVPYVLDQTLYVDGERVPGTWVQVEQAGGAWVGWPAGNQVAGGVPFRWGTDTEPRALPGQINLTPKLSPDGGLLAAATTDGGGRVVVLGTASGEEVASLDLDVGTPRDTDAIGVIAVTDDGKVFLNDGRMWVSDAGDALVDLDETEPQQRVHASTAAGLIVLDDDGEDGDGSWAYLADVDDSGRLTSIEPLGEAEGVVNPSGTWSASGGSWGGEAPTDPTIVAVPIGGGETITLDPPDERAMLVRAWEDDDLLIAELYDDAPTGLARCSIREERCLVIDTP